MLQLSLTSTPIVFVYSYLFFFLTAIHAAQDTCYWPSGSVAGNYKTCSINPNNPGIRWCCAAADVCLSNGLCFGASLGAIYRGACTDQTWQNSNCPKVFITEHPNGTANMFNCVGEPVFRTDTGSCSATDNYHWTGAQVVSSQTTCPSSGIVTVTSTASSSVSNDCPGLGRTVGLGVGLGVGLPLLALAAGMGVLWRSERRKRVQEAEQKLSTSAVMSAGEGTGPKTVDRPSRYHEIGGYQMVEMPGESEDMNNRGSK